MASFRRQKEALRAAVLSYCAGCHYITQEVESNQSILTENSKSSNAAEQLENIRTMLEADYQRIQESPIALEMFADFLDEEDLYPYGSEWPREALSVLVKKVIFPELNCNGTDEINYQLRFKKGFKDLLSEFASSLDGFKKKNDSLDHWLVNLINTAFYAGITVAAQSAENTKLYYNIISDIEEETEPWSKYPQLGRLLDKQLQRETKRRTGLVTDLDFE